MPPSTCAGDVGSSVILIGEPSLNVCWTSFNVSFDMPGQIDRIWSMSSVYVMPSVSEPFGITPLEALQAGVPVILSNQSGVAEVMPHALKADFWDTDALADAICSVLKYNSLASMLTKKAGSEIRNLSWTKAAVKIKNLYEEIAH